MSKSYSVHEMQTPTIATFTVDPNSMSKIKMIIDSTIQNSDSNKAGCKPISINVSPDAKVICFENPCECYLLSFSHDLIKIDGIYLPSIDSRAWLVFKEYVPAIELSRIQNRFTSEVINRGEK